MHHFYASEQILLPHEYFQAISHFYMKSNIQRVFWELFVKIGSLGFFGFRALKFFILILHGQLQKKERKGFYVSIREALRESSGKVD